MSITLWQGLLILTSNMKLLDDKGQHSPKMLHIIILTNIMKCNILGL